MAKKKTVLETGVVILEPKLTEVALSSGYNKTEAEKIAAGYMPFMARINELSEPLKLINKENPTAEDVKIARINRLLMVKVRTEGIQVQKKADKEESLIRGRLVDSLVKVVESSAELTELEYSKIEKFHENKIKEAEETLRVARGFILSPYGTDTSYIPLGKLTEEQFTDLEERERLAFEQREQITKRKEYIDWCISVFKNAGAVYRDFNLFVAGELYLSSVQISELKEADIDGLVADIEEKVLAANRSAEEKETERLRLKGIQDKKDIALQQRVDSLIQAGATFTGVNFFQDTEEPVISKEELSTLSEKDFKNIMSNVSLVNKAIKQEQSEKEEELRLLKDKQIESDRLDAEEKERIRQAAVAPDKEKINALYIALKNTPIPDVTSNEAKKITRLVSESILLILAEIKNEAKQIK